MPALDGIDAEINALLDEIGRTGDRVIILWDGRATAKDGKPYRNSYAWFFKMKGGKAVEVTAFLDLPAYDDILRRPMPDSKR